jgi:O-antigen/teichoic acid export membrane protein
MTMRKPTSGMADSLFMLTAAKVWVTALAILVVPAYIRYLGVEAYGVIGFFAAMQSALLVFDFGLSTTVTKKLAQTQQTTQGIREARNLLRSTEWVFIGVACFVLLMLSLFSRTISAHWALSKAGNSVNMQWVVCLAAAALAAQWPSTLYTSALNGLHRIKVLSLALSVAAFLRVGASVYVAWLTSDLTYFFLTQCMGALVQTVLLRHLAWKYLNDKGHKPEFMKQSLSGSAKFTGDIAIIGVISIVLTQGDKLVLSQSLNLADFGAYTLAATAAAGLYVLAHPFYSAVFPYFSRLVLRADQGAIDVAYRRISELIACGLVPLAAVLIVMPYQVLWVWTGNPELSRHAASALRLLSAGTVINGMLLIPYAYQISVAVTRLSLWMNVAAVVFFLPLLWFLSMQYGLVGGAMAWLTMNLALLLVWPALMHRHLLKGQAIWWYCIAVTLPIVCAIMLLLGVTQWVATDISRISMLCVLVMVAVLNFLILVAILPNARRSIVEYISAKRAIYANHG